MSASTHRRWYVHSVGRSRNRNNNNSTYVTIIGQLWKTEKNEPKSRDGLRKLITDVHFFPRVNSAWEVSIIWDIHSLNEPDK